MKNNELTGKDLLLALLYCPGIKEKENEPIIGRTRLTKMIFLFEKELKGEFFRNMYIQELNFEPYNFGPYSKGLFDDLRFFLSIGFIFTEATTIPISNAEKSEYVYSCDDGLTYEDIDDDDTEDYELKYFLSPNGIKYVKDNIWGVFSNTQKNNLIEFKRRINTISLDSLLKYVYNKYEEYTEKSIIAEKYLEKGY
jgi:uncharacterized protein YwgA